MGRGRPLSVKEEHALRAAHAEWSAHSTSCEPADRPATEAAIIGLHRLIGRPAPRFVWCDSPVTGMVLASLLSEHGVPRGSLEGALGDRLPEALEPESLRRLITSDMAADRVDDELRGSLEESLRRSLRAADAIPARPPMGKVAKFLLWAAPWHWPYRINNYLWGMTLLDNGTELQDELWDHLGRYFDNWADGPRAWNREARKSADLLLHAALGSWHWIRWLYPGDRQCTGQGQAGLVMMYTYYQRYGRRRYGLLRYPRRQAKQLSLWATIARSAGPWFPEDGIVVCTERPLEVHEETVSALPYGAVSRRIQRVDGPAVLYRDGWHEYALNGSLTLSR